MDRDRLFWKLATAGPALTGLGKPCDEGCCEESETSHVGGLCANRNVNGGMFVWFVFGNPELARGEDTSDENDLTTID